mgnify:CR=1 FL=1
MSLVYLAGIGWSVISLIICEFLEMRFKQPASFVRYPHYTDIILIIDDPIV